MVFSGASRIIQVFGSFMTISPFEFCCFSILCMQSIPGWWIWFYYISPVAWTLRGIISSQLGDVEERITGPGFEGTVKEYLEVSLGFEPGWIAWSAVILVAFSLLFFSVFAISVKVLNFQNRWSEIEILGTMIVISSWHLWIADLERSNEATKSLILYQTMDWIR